jgi:endonuclease YncB( thermonuclease family)
MPVRQDARWPGSRIWGGRIVQDETERRRGKGQGALLLAAILTACGPARSPEPAPGREPPGIVDRVKVLSADILVVDGRHLRLSNAFAPEGVPNARCWAEAVAARQGMLAVQNMVRTAHAISVTPTGGRDEYDRFLATISLDGVDLGQTLFAEGLAAQPPKGRFPWCEPLSAAGPGAPSLDALLRP